MISQSKFRTPALSFAFVLTLALLILSFSGAAMAQETRGSIRGVVVDPNGQPVTGATVVAKNQQTSLENTVATGDDGIFVIPKLVPGKYTLTIETTSGFKKKSVTDLDVKLGETSLGNMALDIGSPTETVTVVSTGEEVIQRDQSMISASFEARKVSELPSNAAGFGIDTLALLIPGVAQNSGGGTNTNGTGISVNGNRGRSNNFQIDGSDNNDLSVGGPNLFVSNSDQVQEFQVITNNYSAQYGRNLGSIVNIVTKSGTNQLHGSGFEYHQDQRHLDSLNNRERATGQLFPDRFLSNIFGFTVGGPIVAPMFGEGGKAAKILKNKAFFFVTYQGQRQPSTVTIRSGGLAVNAADLPLLSAAFPGNVVINDIVTLNPSVLALGGTTIRPRTDLSSCNATTSKAAGNPLSVFSLCNQDFIDFTNPNTGVTQRVTGFLIERLAPFNFTQTDYSARGDVNVTKKDSVNVRYIFQDGVQQNDLVSTNGFTGDLIFGTKNLGGSWTRQINNHMVNEFRTVRTRLAVDFGGGCNPAAPGCIPGPSLIEQGQIESINPNGIRGVTLTGNALRAMGGGGGLPQGRDTILYDFLDNLTWTRGRHSFIFGGEYKHTSAVVPFLPNFGGAATFNSALRIFNNAPSAFSVALGVPDVAYTEKDQYYFVQDDFKFRSNLTLNLGVRYEYTGQPIDSLTNLTIARESGATPFFNPALPVSARIVPKVPADKNNFAPRVGFAYTPHWGKEGGFMKRLLGEDSTVIRGGFAIAYDPAFYNILLNVANSSPFSIALAAASTQLPATSPLLPLPNSIFGADVRASVQASGVLPIGKLDPKWLSQTQVATNFRSPYSEQWSFGIQRQIGKSSVAEVRYVGNHGVGLFQSVLANPFVGVSGNYVLQNGVPTTAVGLPIATTPCTVGGSNTPGQAPNCLGGFFGFTRNITVNGLTTPVSFPNFSSILPAGVTGLSCVDNPATPDNEGACNGRVRATGAVTNRVNTAESRYDALQAQWNGRFLKRALNIGATYTFSKTIDDSSEVFAFNGENSILPQNAFDFHPERGVSALHRPHIFSLNAIYDLPFRKAQHGFVGHLLGGWQLNAVHVYNSGRRYSPSQTDNAGFLGLGPSYLTGGEALRPFIGNPNAPQTTVGISQIDAFFFFGPAAGGPFTNVTNLNGFVSLNDLNNGVIRSVSPSDVRFIYNGPGAAKIFGTPFGNSTRYNLLGPPINQTNIGIFKNTRAFGETHPVIIQFRAELFNAFNHPQIGFGVTRNSSLPSTSLDAAGLATGAFADNQFIPLARRVVQFGLRLTF